MDEVLLAGPTDELTPLPTALEQLPWAIRRIERVTEVEQAVRSSRATLLVIADSFCEPRLLARLQRTYPDRLFIAWLPRGASARSAELFDHGFAEVLSPTMSAAELIARLRNVESRRPAIRREPASLGLLTVDAAHGIAAWGDSDLRLTRRERELLQALVEASSATVRREDLYRTVWGYAMARGDRTVDVNVRRLRAKLAAVTDDLAVATEPGVGYRLDFRSTDVAVTAL